MKQIMEVEVRELTIPEHWHTASECRKRAESWENDELKSCMEVVLASIWECAGKGGTETTHNIYTNRPAHFYETFKEKMTMLGYKVEAPTVPNDYHHSYKCWRFSW